MTSIVCPGLANGGSSACTVTAATFLSCGLVPGRNRDPEFREHVDDALNGERRLARLVARAVEADDEAVAHQLVRAHARDGREVLDALRVRRRASTSAALSSARAMACRADMIEVSHQKGAQGELKKREASLAALASDSAPLPPYEIFAFATCEEEMVLVGDRSIARITPDSRTYSLP